MRLGYRFWSKVIKTDEHWVWIAGKDRDGYGTYLFKGHKEQAHRLAWEESNGEIDSGLTIDHLCRVKNCVRPEHLEPCTIEENNRRKEGKEKSQVIEIKKVPGKLIIV